MFRGEIKGFTIIETILFLAISGLLVAVAMASIGSKQEFVQFTDSMRGLQSFVETQYSAAQSGVNDLRNGDEAASCGPTTGGTSNDCIVMGRIMTFEEDSSEVRYYTLLGEALTAKDEAAAGGTLTFDDASPSLESGDRTFNIPWGAQFTGGKNINSSGTEENSFAFGFLREPRSINVTGVTYISNTGDDFLTTKGKIVNAYSTAASFNYGENVEAYYCFKSADEQQKAVLSLENTQVNVFFDPIPTNFNC